MADQSLYERLGGVFAIAAVIDRFSDEVVKNRQWPNRETVASRVPQDVAYGARLSQQETQAVIDFIWTTWGARAK